MDCWQSRATDGQLRSKSYPSSRGTHDIDQLVFFAGRTGSPNRMLFIVHCDGSRRACGLGGRWLSQPDTVEASGERVGVQLLLLSSEDVL